MVDNAKGPFEDPNDISDLDSIFDLPAAITDNVKLVEAYNVIVSRLKRESQHVKMNTVQLLLIERIANNYVALKAKERHAIGDVGGFAHTTAQKDFNTFWLTMTQQFQRSLERSTGNEREAALVEALGIIRGVLAKESPAVRNRLMEQMADAFEGQGL